MHQPKRTGDFRLGIFQEEQKEKLVQMIPKPYKILREDKQAQRLSVEL